MDPIKNTGIVLARNLRQVLRMQPPPLRKRVDLYRFNSPETISSLSTGSDKDFGGFSECQLQFVERSENQSSHLLFKGNLSFDLRADTIYLASGYCGFRTEELTGTIFGSEYHDLSSFSHFEVKARSADPKKRFLVNLRPSTFSELDLYQYPLKFVSNDWHTFRIPLSKFILTQKGRVLNAQRYLPADRIETIGISILKQPGPFHLEISHFSATNPDEVSVEELELRAMGMDEIEEEEKDPRLKDLFHTVKVYVEGDNKVKTYEARNLHEEKEKEESKPN